MFARVSGPMVGLAAGAVTLGVAELTAMMMVRFGSASGTPSPLLAVGAAFVDRTPAWLKDLAIAIFGTNDKIALFVGMGMVLVGVCAALGVLTTRNRRLGVALFAVVGAIGAAAVLSRPRAGGVDVVPTLLGTLTGLAVLAWLAARAARAVPVAGAAEGDAGTGPGRRGVLAWAGGLAILGVAGTYLGRTMSQAQEAVQAASRRVSDRFVDRSGQLTLPPEADLAVPGLDSFVTANDRFYRIDTALSVPQVDPDSWAIRVHGMVEREISVTFTELLEQEFIDTVVTLCCVSNAVGGNLIGNAVWTGWPIRELLAKAGVLAEADMVLSTSEDGWTASTPVEALTDDRDSVLAVLMNDEPLPAQHGFPVRMVVPGLYGYVSATKWVVDLEVTRFEDTVAYWTTRGWSDKGPIKVQSRIDVPRPGEAVNAGPGVLAGMAWSPHVGITRVEVRIDDGQWQQAELSGEVTIATWRQWRLDWDATAGDHTVTVRATNADGETQTKEIADPAPDGATGWHTIDISVS